MTLRNTVRFLTAAAGLSLLAACATAPQPLQGSFPQVTPQQAVAATPGSSPVRWGGRIVETQPKQDRICFHMVALPLNASDLPQCTSSVGQQGRCVGSLDAIYTPVE